MYRAMPSQTMCRIELPFSGLNVGTLTFAPATVMSITFSTILALGSSPPVDRTPSILSTYHFEISSTKSLAGSYGSFFTAVSDHTAKRCSEVTPARFLRPRISSVGARSLKSSTVASSAKSETMCAGELPCTSCFVKSARSEIRSFTMSTLRHFAARCTQVTPRMSGRFMSAPSSINCAAARTSPRFTARSRPRERCFVCSASQLAAK
mmetsp:Transcript_108526/g.312646  ORF Transcript_108526/g.312646 Transcript_108526/m.312646 type:complete len:208 (+) Transcript_108526:840-1463(+)